MKSEEELHKLIKEAQEHGSVIFVTDDYKADRQKLYRMKQAFVEKFPVLEATWDFSLKRIKPNGLKILLWEEPKEVELIEEQPPQAVAKPKKQPKMIPWVEDELKGMDTAEKQLGPLPKSTIEFFHTRRVAAEYYLELRMQDIDDLLLEKVVRSGREADHVPLVLAAFGFADYVSKPKTIDDQIVENARLIAESEPGPQLERLIEYQERLRKRRDDELSKRDLLG